MRLIDADELKDFFFGETSGTEETIRDLAEKHGLTYLNDVNEDEVMEFAKDLLRGVQNVIDTQKTAYNVKKVMKELEVHAIEFEAFGICSDYVELSNAIHIVRKGIKQ